MSSAKKTPEFDLPPVLVSAVKGYIGPRNSGKLSSDARSKIFNACSTASTVIGRVLEQEQATTAEDDD